VSTSRGPERAGSPRDASRRRGQPDAPRRPPPAGDVPRLPPGSTGLRRQARERALHLLYEAEAKGETPAGVLAELPVAPDPFAASLVTGVGERAGEIDGLVSGHASGWALGRMPAVDRQLLRLATFELLAEPEVPPAVVIDEAVELAKEYSTEESGRYVNGVLAAIARTLGRIDALPAEPVAPPAPEAPAAPAPEGPAPAVPEAPAPDAAAPARARPGALGAVRPARPR